MAIDAGGRQLQLSLLLAQGNKLLQTHLHNLHEGKSISQAHSLLYRN